MTAPARRVRLDLAYDGTDFSGWQLQAGPRTVQGAIEEVLARLHGGRRVAVRGAGRTDAGVHARGQVADCEVDARLDDAELAYVLGRLLPADVRPWRVRSVHAAFHAQYDARAKTYRYHIDRTPHGDPFASRYALHWPHPLDAGSIGAALRALVGRRDWTGFTGAACRLADRVRHVFRAEFTAPAAHRGVFEFSADGFLTHMVRNVVGTLLEVGRGRMDVGRIDEILARGDRHLAGPTAPAHGLCLEHVAYDDDESAGAAPSGAPREAGDR